MEVRLQKYFTDCGVLSRRAAEAEIAAGRVKVNGTVAVIGQKINTDTDVVTYLGKQIEPTADRRVYIMLNKPRGVVSTASDEKGRRCVTGLVADVGVRVYPIGRLDMDSDGLLLLTNDGELANFLTHPKHEIPKIYQVRVRGIPSREKLAKLGEPLDIDGSLTLPVKVVLLSTDRDSALLELTLYEGKNRQIRRMCEANEIEILKLTRTAVGNITLSDLPVGKWEPLTRGQVGYLKRAMKG